MSYRLSYFALRGRGEQIRILLHALGQPFEEVTITRPQLVEMKKAGPQLLAFGSIPLLEDGDFRLVQGPVIMAYLARQHGIAPTDAQQAARADVITLGAEDMRSKYFGLFGEGAEAKQAAFVAGDWKSRWLPAFAGLLKVNGATGFMVGSTLTHADVAAWDALDAVLSSIKGAALDGFPELADFRARIAAIPAIATYLQQRKA